MLAVPGWCDSHRLPNALPVARALNSTARARLDWTPQRADLDLIVRDALAWERKLSERE